MNRMHQWSLPLQSLGQSISQSIFKGWSSLLTRRVASPAPDPYAHAPCAHFTLDAAGNFVQLNAKALEWFDCAAEQVVGLCGPAPFLSAESREQFPGCLAVLQVHGHIDGLEFEMVTRRGATRRVWLYATAAYDSRGLLYQSACMLHDVTELVRARNRLQVLAAEQRAVLDNDLLGVVKVAGSRIVWKNRTLERLFGYAPGELRGPTLRALYRSEQQFTETTKAAATALALGERYRARLELQRKDGTGLWVDLCAVRVDANREETVWTFLDVTPPRKRSAEPALAAVRWRESHQAS
jgi:PAS domain S-box-containing protein